MTEGQKRYKKYKETYAEYRKRFNYSPHGYCVRMYDRMLTRTKFVVSYIGKEVSISFNDFVDFLYKSGFEGMYETYIKSGKRRTLAPSVDRIDNSKGYELDNMQLITHGENSSKGAKQELKNRHNQHTPKDKLVGSKYVTKPTTNKEDR